MSNYERILGAGGCDNDPILSLYACVEYLCTKSLSINSKNCILFPSYYLPLLGQLLILKPCFFDKLVTDMNLYLCLLPVYCSRHSFRVLTTAGKCFWVNSTNTLIAHKHVVHDNVVDGSSMIRFPIVIAE